MSKRRKKKSQLPRYDVANLADELRRAFMQGKQAPFKNFLPNSLKPLPDSQNYIDINSGKVWMRFHGIDQILYFEEEKSHMVFRAHTVGLENGQKEELAKSVYSRIESIEHKRRARFSKIFKKPYIEKAVVNFRGDDYEGLRVCSRLVELPRGQEGHLSRDLFEYGYNVIVLPSFRLAIGSNQPEGDVWYEF